MPAVKMELSSSSATAAATAATAAAAAAAAAVSVSASSAVTSGTEPLLGVALPGGEVQVLVDVGGEPCLEVECGDERALLYVRRLCQGSKGPSIRYRGDWLTPNEFQFVSGRETAKDWKRSIRHRGKSLKTLMSKGVLQVHPPICDCPGCRISSPVNRGRLADKRAQMALTTTATTTTTTATTATTPGRGKEATASSSVGGAADGARREAVARRRDSNLSAIISSLHHSKRLAIVRDGSDLHGEDLASGSERPSLGDSPPLKRFRECTSSPSSKNNTHTDDSCCDSPPQPSSPRYHDEGSLPDRDGSCSLTPTHNAAFLGLRPFLGLPPLLSPLPGFPGILSPGHAELLAWQQELLRRHGLARLEPCLCPTGGGELLLLRQLELEQLRRLVLSELPAVAAATASANHAAASYCAPPTQQPITRLDAEMGEEPRGGSQQQQQQVKGGGGDTCTCNHDDQDAPGDRATNGSAASGKEGGATLEFDWREAGVKLLGAANIPLHLSLPFTHSPLLPTALISSPAANRFVGVTSSLGRRCPS